MVSSSSMIKIVAMGKTLRLFFVDWTANKAGLFGSSGFFGLFRSFHSSHPVNQMNQINEMNQTNQTDQTPVFLYQDSSSSISSIDCLSASTKASG